MRDIRTARIGSGSYLWFLAVLAGALLAIPKGALAQTPTRRSPAPHRVLPKPATSAAEQPRFKAIFEPVNYSQDINLTDVFFASVDEGWVSGEHATILHTADGGKTWAAQVGGDASNNDKAIGQLRFLDQKHGWAIQEGPRLLRTLDGQNWEEVDGKFPPGVNVLDYAFTSVRHGILLGSNMGGFYVTNDGGRHWEHAAPCELSATVQGLTRLESCRVNKLQMLSARLGYAMAGWSGGIVFLRTDDAGGHWTSVVPNVKDCCEPDFFFIDSDRGVLLFNNGKTYLTSDGGRNWRALLSGNVGLSKQGPAPLLRFADPEVGWALGASPDNSDTFRVSFSTDSGQHWKTSPNITFPIGPRYAELKFALPRRDRAYVIGPHGMIYRYRIVPADFSASNSLPAPLMTGFDTSRLTAAAARVQQDIATLQSQISTASGGTVSFSPGTSPSTGVQTVSSVQAVQNPASVGFTQATDTAATSAQQAQPTASTASGVGAFTQDTAAGAAPSPDSTGANLTQGFTQSVDTSPASVPLQSCCAAAVQSLQTDLTTLNQAVPPATTQFRPLNLVIAGLQVVTTILNQANQLRMSFSTLKHAPSLQAAAVSLQQLSGAISSTQQAVTTGFQNPGAYFAATAPASFTQDVGASGTAAPPSAVPGGTPTAASGATPSTTGSMPAVAASTTLGAATPPQGAPFALLEGGTNQAVAAAIAQVVAANAATQDLVTLAANSVVVQALQQSATGAVQQAASCMSSAASNSLSVAAGGLVGGLFKKRNPTVVYLWGLSDAASSISVPSSNPALDINYASVPAVNPAGYAPALVRLVPAQNGWFLVGAAKGQAGALQNSGPDWEVYSSFNEQRIPAQVSQTAPGQARIQPVQPLAPGTYAVVLRPISKNKKFSGADVASLQGDGLVFNSVWKLVVGPGAGPQ